MTPKQHRIVLRFCLTLLLLLIGNLVLSLWRQQASIDLAIAKGQQLYMSPDGQPLGLDTAELANLYTADSNLIFVDALPMPLAEARPWANLGCTGNSCAHLTYYNRTTGGTVNQILLLHDNSILAQWQDDLARPAGSRFIANEAIKIAGEDPAVTAVVGQYVTWIQQNALYTSRPADDYEERASLVQNGMVAMWATRSDDRPFSIGVPQPYDMLPLPRLNSQVLVPPWQTVLFISSRVEDPSACLTWLEFLTTRADVMTAVPARQSVANGRAWQNEVGPENAALLRESLARLDALRAPLAGSNSPLLDELHAHLGTPRPAHDLLVRAIAAEPAAQIRDGGAIAPGYDAELDELRSLNDNCGAYLVDMEVRERERSGIASLKVEYNKVHGFYIEVTHANVDKIPDDYCRRQTLKNAERYITPELKAFEDKALSAQERSLAREKLLYEAILDELLPAVPTLQTIARAVAQLDLLAGFADTALKRNWSKPEFAPETGLTVTGGRHPVVEGEMANSAETFIANDCRLAENRRLLLITGPNMGGKSTYMRQVALIALLAHIGSYVPADRCVLGPLDRMFTRIGASDDLASGRSTFMVEMTEAAAILHHATANSLVLMDEIGRGTSTFDGMALAFAILRHLIEKNRCLTLFATHYFELTRLAHEYPELANVHLDAVEHGHRIIFLHAVEEGPANQSYGIQVAALAGIPNSVVRAARRQLREFEQRAAVDPLQPDLFAQGEPQSPEPEPHPALEQLAAIDPDSLTPRQALDALYALKGLLK